MKRFKEIVLDTETTGVDREADEVLTLSMIDGDGNVLWDKLYKPERTAEWPEASAVNGIFPKDVEDCPAMRDDVADIKAILQSAERVIVYNAGFDLPMLDNAGIHVMPWQEVSDTMLEFADYYGEDDARHPGQKRWKRLGFAAGFLGFDWGEGHAHASVDDCRATLFVQHELDEARENGQIGRESVGNVLAAAEDFFSSRLLGFDEIEPFQTVFRLNDGGDCVSAGTFEAYWRGLPAWMLCAWMLADNGQYSAEEVSRMSEKQAVRLAQSPSFEPAHAFYTAAGFDPATERIIRDFWPSAPMMADAFARLNASA